MSLKDSISTSWTLTPTCGMWVLLTSVAEGRIEKETFHTGERVGGCGGRPGRRAAVSAHHSATTTTPFISRTKTPCVATHVHVYTHVRSPCHGATSIFLIRITFERLRRTAGEQIISVVWRATGSLPVGNHNTRRARVNVLIPPRPMKPESVCLSYSQ